MTVHLSTPPGMMQPTPYHHVAVGSGTRHVYVSGQVGRSVEEGSTPLVTLAEQVAQALRNTAVGLAGADATFGDVVRLTFFVTRWRPELIEDVMAGVEAAAEEVGLPTPMPPASLIGVEHLFEPDVLVEVEATAVCD